MRLDLYQAETALIAQEQKFEILKVLYHQTSPL